MASARPVGFSFDSNILIDALNGDRRARLELIRAERRFVSRISWIEVMSKVRSGETATVEDFFDDFTIEDVTAPVARRAAELRFERPKLKLPDAVILATALVGGRTLVTRNTRDFSADMPGIRVPYQLQQQA